MNIKPLVLIVVLGAAGYGLWQWRQAPAEVPAVQGWVEADTLFIGADEAGRVVALGVKEGEQVKAGAALFELQSDLQEAELRQARAALDEARARLARAEAAQQRPEEIAVLEAQEARAKAAIEQSRPELGRAEDLVARGVAATSRLEQARSAFNRDTAALAEVQRQIEVAHLKSRKEDIVAAQEVVAAATARVAASETRLGQRRVAAPAEGVVQQVYYRQGEVVPAGRPVVALLPPGNIKLRFFVPEGELPKIAYGMGITVQCDGCGDGLAARVSFIASQAEFTPPVIYSREERAKLVFRVEARPEKPEAMRVGQPITVHYASDPTVEAARAGR